MTISGIERGVILSGNNVLHIPSLGTGGVRVEALNDLGHVVGTSDVDGSWRPFVYRGGKTQEIEGQDGFRWMSADGINDAGDIVGWGYTPEGARHALLISQNTTFPLGTLPGGEFSQAHAINNDGAIVGRAITGSNRHAATFDAFLYEDGIMTNLGASSWNCILAADINERGEVAATVSFTSDSIVGYEEPAVLKDGSLQRLLDDIGQALAINDHGQIAGRSVDGACLWEDGRRIDLRRETAAVPADVELYLATDINNAGRLVGIATDEQGASHAFALDPYTPPAARPALELAPIVGVDRNRTRRRVLRISGKVRNEAERVVCRMGRKRIRAVPRAGEWRMRIPLAVGRNSLRIFAEGPGGRSKVFRTTIQRLARL